MRFKESDGYVKADVVILTYQKRTRYENWNYTVRVDEHADYDVAHECANFAERGTYRHGHSPGNDGKKKMLKNIITIQ